MNNRELRRRLRNIPYEYDVLVCVEDEDSPIPGIIVDHANKQVILLPEGQAVNFDYVDFDQTEFFGHIEFTTTDEEKEEDEEDDASLDDDLDDEDDDEDDGVIEGQFTEVEPTGGEENVG